ncbi:MAG: N-acetyltransferase [Mycobacterium sp.]|nr:N-acetyltransferase [Mycobacterium sp.]
MRVRDATAGDADACVQIYTPYVRSTVITFETEVPTVREMAARITAARASHEWLVLEDDGDVIGYAYAHQFNPRAAYLWSVETSIYLSGVRHRRGGGRLLYGELLTRLADRGYRRAFAGVTQPNEASMGFHHAFGFERAGEYRRVGWKQGAWRDVVWLQRDLADGDPYGPPPEITPAI